MPKATFPQTTDDFLSARADTLDRATANHPGKTGNHYGHDFDPRPPIRFETPFAALPTTADEDTIRDYAQHWMVGTLVPDPRSIEPLLAVANELKAHLRAVGPLAALVAAMPQDRLEPWAQVLLDAIRSPGFAGLAGSDKETLARLHATCVARMEGAKINAASHARGARHRRAMQKRGTP